MRIKKSYIILILFTLLGHSYHVFGQDDESNTADKTDLQDKHYRQALFHYFQDDHAQALTLMDQSKAKLTSLDSRSSLFEAGLQLSSGLLQQAKQTLVNFDHQFTNVNDNEKRPKNSVKANELTLISLLSLTDQYLQQGDNTQAKDTLKRIKSVSPTYYPQYHILSQLAYWPEETILLPVETSDEVNISSPYIKLNDALRLIELSKFQAAITALQTLKKTTWHKPKENFWKTLFLNESSFSSQSEEDKMAVTQGQAIQDYAQLLLAQIYISQQNYDLAFLELKAFPEQSPYAESALFLFAFASQQVKQYGIAFNLLNLHYKKYPYSQLGWQSAELMAQQVSEQQSLSQGVNAYQLVESFFLQRQQDLDNFSHAFQKSGDLLQFSQTNSINTLQDDKTQVINAYLPQSVWLQQALYDAELSSLYQHLISIDIQTAQVNSLLDKTKWLAEIISLNQQRKQRIIATKETRQYNKLIEQLTSKRDHLDRLLSEKTEKESHAIFADNKELKWLERIANSQEALDSIGTQKNTVDYKERLARVQGVLSWQLTQDYPQKAWQHKKVLHQVDNAIATTTLQQQQLAKISKTDNNLEEAITKHKASIAQLNMLVTKSADLRRKFSDKIRKKVNNYIDEQNIMLAEHLLSTRQGMANVLEQMATEDKRLSQKLTSLHGNSSQTSTQKTSMLLEEDSSQTHERTSIMAGAQ